MPAPAETKTCASRFDCRALLRVRLRSRPPDPAHPPELAPGRAIAALRVVFARHRFGSARRSLRASSLRADRPDPRTPPRRGSRCARTRNCRPPSPQRAAARGRRACRKRPVDPAERLDADEVAQHEHVERDLQLLLGLDLRRRMSGLAGLVVLNDPARAERIEVDAVDLSGEREAVPRSRPRCSSCGERSSRTKPRSGAGRAADSEAASSRTNASRSRSRPCSSSRRCRSVSSIRTPAIASPRHSRMKRKRIVDVGRVRASRRRAASGTSAKNL